MKKCTRRFLIGIASLFITAAVIGVAAGYSYLFAPQFRLSKPAYVYVDRDDTVDSLYHKVQSAGNPKSMRGFRWMIQYRDMQVPPHTGRYVIRPDENVYHVFSRLYRGYQEPMNLTIGSSRTMDRLAGSIGRKLMVDSAEIAALMSDAGFLQQIGYTQETLPALIIPDTYQVRWDISVEDFFKRMQKEHKRFWNEERTAKAQVLGMTPQEVCTLASIVEEETNNQAEKPMVAGLYINRLRMGMALQADPTIKFALQNFALRRITNTDLQVDSPYNTYLYAGLPPGPIRIATPAGIDAVLNYTPHDYIYMCAKEDFSGTHNFATNYSEHLRNAAKYQKALNERKIYR